jgi:acyl carrier protein
MSPPYPKSILDTLAGFFARALDRPSFALDDNFFTVGGDSIAAASVLTSISETFQVELRFRDILEAPTPLRLALTVLRARTHTAGHDLSVELESLPAEDATRLLAHLQKAPI